MARAVVFAIACLASVVVVAADPFRFSNSYGDHMVLQQGPQQAVLWGFGTPGAKVTAFHKGKTTDTIVEARGTWLLKLTPTAAGGPYTITATQTVADGGMQTISLNDVLFGDVWICSGQSNMQFSVSQAFNATAEIAAAADFPEIRLFTAALVQSDTPFLELQSVEQPWSIAGPSSVGGKNWTYFSATCWFYGRDIYKQRKYPIGLIASDWGGTPVEAWSSPAALAKCNPNMSPKPQLAPAMPAGVVPGPSGHSVLWNAMIHPLLNMTIFGTVWYQGEANAPHPDSYNCTFPAMINDWRLKFFEGSGGETDSLFPFGFVQLAADGTSNTTIGGFPVIRWAQTADFGHVPNPLQQNVFMAVAMDLGDPTSPFGSVHPRWKQAVGARLALAGRAIAYREPGLVFSGPLIESCHYMRRVFGNQDVLQLNFSSTGTNGLEVRNPWGFEVLAGTEWRSARAEATGVKTVQLTTVSLPKDSPRPISVRYAWRTDPCPHLYCSVYSKAEKLPTPPFITNVE